MTGQPEGHTLRGEEDRALRVERADGGLRLVLSRGEETCLAAGLDALPLVSAGQPWQPAFPGLADAAVLRTDDGGLAVHGLAGGLEVRLAFAFGDGALHTTVTWRNPGRETRRDLALGLALPLPPAADATSVTLPQVLYRGNPSADPDRTVPRLGTGPHGGLVVEEHRLPVPCAHAEWRAAGGPRFLTLYALDPGEFSLGALAREHEHTALLALSGPVMFNGEPDVAYVHKATTAPYPHGYRDLAPGATLTARYALRWGAPPQPGHGFRDMVHHGRRLYAPRGARPLGRERIVELKTAALDRRWHEDGDAAGYQKFTGPDHTPGYLYGWTGQCLRLAWCDIRLGLARREEWRIDRAHRAVAFYLDGSAAGAPPGLRLSFYGTGDGRWSGFERDGRPFVSARAYGDTLVDLAELTTLLRGHGRPVPEAWTRALDAGLAATCDGPLTPEGLVPFGWDMTGAPLPAPPGGAGLSCVLALLKAPSPGRLKTATRLLERYQQAFADDFATPFAFATLDAVCEDKEAGMAFFQCAAELFRLTGEARHRAWAEATADWLLTWVYQWNPPYPAGTAFREHGFDATGWPAVSIQNHHVDVFFPIHELAAFGEATGRADYTELAWTVFHAMGQCISTRPGEWGFEEVGEQPEGIFPTHWQWRGASNTWNPSWVISQVLATALRLPAR